MKGIGVCTNTSGKHPSENNLHRCNLLERLSTAPHQSRNKRELTRAVELLKLRNGAPGECHRLLPAPLALSANVFASVPAR